jgi:hypothetical protein
MLGDLVQLTITDVGIMRRTVYARRNFNEDDYDLSDAPRPGLARGKTFRTARSPGRSAPGASKSGGRRTAGKSFKERDGRKEEKGDKTSAGGSRNRAGSKTTKKVSGRGALSGAKSTTGGAKSSASTRTRPSAASARRKKTTRRR